jgi:hypothetical protein
MFKVDSFARSNINPKNPQIRHPRVGGDPVKWLIKIDSRLRWNDGDWKFYINSSQFSFVQNAQIKDSLKVIAA